MIPSVLKSNDIFKGLGADNIDRFARIARVLDFIDGDIILDLYQDPAGLYVIIQGNCQVVLPGPPGEKPDILATLGPGDIFGEFSFIDNNPASAQVIAAKDVSLAYFPFAHLKALLASDPDLERRFLWQLAKVLVTRLRLTNRSLVMARRLLIKAMQVKQAGFRIYGEPALDDDDEHDTTTPSE